MPYDDDVRDKKKPARLRSFVSQIRSADSGPTTGYSRPTHVVTTAWAVGSVGRSVGQSPARNDPNRSFPSLEVDGPEVAAVILRCRGTKLVWRITTGNSRTHWARI
jgi:hypothetical protein